MDYRPPAAYSPPHGPAPRATPQPITTIVVRERIEGPFSFITSALAPQKTRTKLLVIGAVMLSAGIILTILLPILTSVDSGELDAWLNDPGRQSGDAITVRGKITKGQSSFGKSQYKFANSEETFSGESDMANDGENVILGITYEDWDKAANSYIVGVVRLNTIVSVYSLPALMMIIGLICIIPPLVYNTSAFLGTKKGTIKERHTIIPAEEDQKPVLPPQYQQFQQSPPPSYPGPPPQFADSPHQQMPQPQQYYAEPPVRPRQPPQTSTQSQPQESENRSEDIFLLDPKEHEDMLEELKAQEKRKKSKTGGPF